MPDRADYVCDLLIIGGGINGCGIARDAAGRGLGVLLCEQGDLAQATSSASTKLFHGGLRYLEHYAFRLVREALKERENLLRAMPHISWPLRFVLPHHAGLRPAWLIRLGLFLYDHLGGREILPATRVLDLKMDAAGHPLKTRFSKAFEYSDCWIDDARLVVLNARDAAENGAHILTRTRCMAGRRENGTWHITLKDLATDTNRTVRARAVINAGGPWVDTVFRQTLGLPPPARIRLVRGSHIVTHRLFDHDRAYMFQNTDGRVVFAIPYEQDFTLIGTTDQDHDQSPEAAECSDDEADYLLSAVSGYLDTPVASDRIVWRYAGVRPLYDDGVSSATAATRDYVLHVAHDTNGHAPLLSVFGGKITTYRRLAEAALGKLRRWFPDMPGNWTAGVPLPGGDFAIHDSDDMIDTLLDRYPFLDRTWGQRLFRTYGLDAWAILGDAYERGDLGQGFGWNLCEAEVRWLMEKEWAETGEDVLWRRTKTGLRLTAAEAERLASWMKNPPPVPPSVGSSSRPAKPEEGSP